MSKFMAMILAGGRGKRMQVLCQGRPKPILPFAGKFRVIDFSLSNCIHSAIDDIAVLTDYRRSDIDSYLNNWAAVNDYADLSLLEPVKDNYRGTADAVYQNLDYVDKSGADKIVILAADHVYNMDYRRMLAFHDKMGADVTVAVVPVPIDQARRFGIVMPDDEGRIVDFVEKPHEPKSNLVSMGIYIFNKDILTKALAQDAIVHESPHDFGYAIIPNLVKQARVFAYRFNGYWRDIGSARAYYEANMELLSEKPALNLNSTWPVLTEDNADEMRSLYNAGVHHSLVGKGCVIKGTVENSILSPGVWVGEDCVVRNSIVLPNAFIDYHSVIDNAILDEGVNIGKFCYVGFIGARVTEESDITVVGKEVNIPSYTAVGRNSQIAPNTGVADFARNAVPGCLHFDTVNDEADKILSNR